MQSQLFHIGPGQRRALWSMALVVMDTSRVPSVLRPLLVSGTQLVAHPSMYGNRTTGRITLPLERRPPSLPIAPFLS